MNNIITLTTDYGIKDYFVSSIKGKLLSLIPNCNIVDITHSIECFNICQASYIVESAYKNFPKGTIHLIAVDHELSAIRKPLIVFCDEHYFITADNGILSFLTKKAKPSKMIYADLKENVFSVDVFIDIVLKICENTPIESLGSSTDSIMEISELKPDYNIDKGSITANVIYEDNFGNAVTNVTKSMFEDLQRGRDFKITVKNRVIKRINKYFSDFKITESASLKDREGELLAVFNELGYLQISLYRSNPNTLGCPRTLLGLGYRDTIKIEFEN